MCAIFSTMPWWHAWRKFHLAKAECLCGNCWVIVHVLNLFRQASICGSYTILKNLKWDMAPIIKHIGVTRTNIQWGLYKEPWNTMCHLLHRNPLVWTWGSCSSIFSTPCQFLLSEHSPFAELKTKYAHFESLSHSVLHCPTDAMRLIGMFGRSSLPLRLLNIFPGSTVQGVSVPLVDTILDAKWILRFLSVWIICKVPTPNSSE